MLDRESTFALPELVESLRRDFVAVAIDQAYQRRQRDAEGDFYRKIASQSPRNDFNRTTQGFYVATAGGDLLLFNNNRDPKKVARLVRGALKTFSREKRDPAKPLADGKPDARWNPTSPEGGLVVRVHAKVLGGYGAPENDWQRILHGAIGRDNLWVAAAEHKKLVAGGLPETLLRRLARFHLVDNTRGEPPMWRDEEIRTLAIQRTGNRIHGTVALKSKDGKRTYDAQILGYIAVKRGRVTRFDLVADGQFQGEGRYTRGAPAGLFPFAISMTLADGQDMADQVPPQGSRGWLRGYLQRQ